MNVNDFLKSFEVTKKWHGSASSSYSAGPFWDSLSKLLQDQPKGGHLPGKIASLQTWDPHVLNPMVKLRCDLVGSQKGLLYVAGKKSLVSLAKLEKSLLSLQSTINLCPHTVDGPAKSCTSWKRCFIPLFIGFQHVSTIPNWWFIGFRNHPP